MDNSIIINKKSLDDNKSYALTAIVLVYNGGPYLESCINSLVNQTLDDLEILLINDASTDDSLSVCKKFERMYDNVFLINKEENGGLGDSGNIGISLARGEYVILVDNDDIVPKDAYEKLYYKAKETDADICIGKPNFIIGNSQFEFDFRESYVWEKERTITDINEFPELFEDVYYWNQVVRRNILIDNNVKLPLGTVYADRYFTHMTYTCAKKIVIIPDCVYLWRQVKSSLSHGRYDPDNFIDRLDSYDEDLDYLINKCSIYFKMLLRRILIPVKGILNNVEFEDIIFNRIRFLIQKYETNYDNLYDNDLNIFENLQVFLIRNNCKFELIQLFQLDIIHQRETYDENGVSYWKLPLFRNSDIDIPDDLFKIKYLINQFISIDELNITKDNINLKNIRIPKYVPIERMQIVFSGLTRYDQVWAENISTFDLICSEEDNALCYNITIPAENLASFELYDVFLKPIYKNKKSNKLRINENLIDVINCDVNNMKPLITATGNISLITQNLDNEFRIDCDENKLKIIVNNKEHIKKGLRMLIRKDPTNELTYLSLNDEKNAFELEWKYFLDPRSPYSLFLTIYNDDGKIKKNVRFMDKYLSEFNQESFVTNRDINVKIYKTKHGDIRLKSY